MPGDVRGKWGDEGNEEGCDVAEDEAHDAANDAKDERLEEELEQNLAGAGADSFADADFACALRDGDEHDVHDTNATDDERDASDERKHARDNREHGASWVKVAGARNDLEVFVAFFELLEFLFNLCDSGFDIARSVRADVDLLNLNRRFEGAGVIDVDEDGIIEVDVIEIDRVVNLVEDADYHEHLVVVGESAGDGLWGAKERHCGFVSDDGDVFAEFVVKELAILQVEIKDFLEVVAGCDDGVVLVNLAGNANRAVADGDWGSGFDGFDLFDGRDVFGREVRFAELTGICQAINEAILGFAEARADKNEVRVVFVARSADEVVDAAS